MLHLICKNPQIGIEVLQQLLLLIRNQFPADEIDFNKFVNLENTPGLKAYDYCQQQKQKGFQNLLSKFYADPNSDTSKGGGILIIQAKIGGPQLADDLNDPDSNISKEYKLLHDLPPSGLYPRNVKSRFDLSKEITG